MFRRWASSAIQQRMDVCQSERGQEAPWLGGRPFRTQAAEERSLGLLATGAGVSSQDSFARCPLSDCSSLPSVIDIFGLSHAALYRSERTALV